MNNSTITMEPAGLNFYDGATKRQMRYVYPGSSSWGGWILYKHPDGQWVSLRKATDADLAAINGAVVKAHHEEQE